jgi:hypothetical protein
MLRPGGLSGWKAVLLATAVGVTAAASAIAQDPTPEGRWCSKEDIGGGVVAERCHFMSYAECQAISRGLTTTFCVQNPRYLAPAPAPPVTDPRNARPRRP